MLCCHAPCFNSLLHYFNGRTSRGSHMTVSVSVYKYPPSSFPLLKHFNFQSSAKAYSGSAQIAHRNPPQTAGSPPIHQMGLPITNSSPPTSHHHTQKVFLFCNYILLGAASSCIFLTLSLRLVPSVCGLFLILLHALTIAGAISGCAAASSGAGRWYGAHMVATVLTAIFQGSVSVLIFTRTGDFLGRLKSYVREDDAAMILKLAGGLCVLIFCLEWVVLTLAFFLKFYAYVDGGDSSVKRSAKVQHEEEEEMKNWPWPFQV